MGLNNPVIFEGVQSVDFIDKTTNLTLGRLRVLQSAELSHEIAKTQLFGGASKTAYASADGVATTTLTVVANEYPYWLVELASGGSATDRVAEATGSVETMVDIVGTSMTDGTAGFTPSATVGQEALLKSGSYRVVATAAQTADLYVVGANIAGSDFVSDDLKIASLDLSAADINAEYGLTFTPNGTAALVVGDISEFEVRAINTDSYKLSVGSETDILKNVEIVVAGKVSSGKQAILTCFNCKGGSLPLSFAPDTFSEISLEFDVLYCPSVDGAFEVEYINTGSSSC
jgi:hypothetical protein